MNSTHNAVFRPGRFYCRHRHLLLQFFCGFVMLALLFNVCSVRAGGPDDDYTQIYLLIDRADAYSDRGMQDLARARYLEAQAKLIEFKQNYPVWHPEVVSFRLKYLAKKLAAAPASEPVPPAAPPKTTPAKPAATTASQAHDLQVKLIQPGGEPRTVLRLHPQAGDRQSLDMTFIVSTKMGAEGAQTPAIKTPPVQMGVDLEVKNVSANGDISYALTFTRAGVGDAAGKSSQMVDLMNASLASIKGMTVTGVTTKRGVSKTVDFKVPPGANPQIRQTLEQTKTAMSQVLLPKEAVGVGAKWEVNRKVKTQGMTVNQTENYEITAMQGDAVTIKTSIVQQAANQKMKSPVMQGMTVEVAKLLTKGTGTATLNLAKLMPTAVVTDGHTEMSMNMARGSNKQAMAMDMDVNFKLASK